MNIQKIITIVSSIIALISFTSICLICDLTVLNIIGMSIAFIGALCVSIPLTIGAIFLVLLFNPLVWIIVFSIWFSKKIVN